MLTKKLRGEIRPASYLSPKERQKALLLTRAIRSSKNVEELLKYQTQLEQLIEKANANKAEIREHARALRSQDIAVVKAHLRRKNDSDPSQNRKSTSVSAGK